MSSARSTQNLVGTIIIIIITSIEARLWQASLLWRVVEGVSAKVL